MPQLPVIAPGQTKMTTASPNRRLDPSAESQPGRDVAMMGKAVAQMGFRMQEVQNLQQRTKASSNTTAKRNLRFYLTKIMTLIFQMKKKHIIIVNLKRLRQTKHREYPIKEHVLYS